jgi:hypothetical protein
MQKIEPILHVSPSRTKDSEQANKNFGLPVDKQNMLK